MLLFINRSALEMEMLLLSGLLWILFRTMTSLWLISMFEHAKPQSLASYEQFPECTLTFSCKLLLFLAFLADWIAIEHALTFTKGAILELELALLAL